MQNDNFSETSDLTPTNYLSDLNGVQRLAAENTTGPVMIVAGPGSGKTRVLTYRIAHLIHSGVPAWSILALTFTNKAAREMKDRIGKIVGEQDVAQLWMGTFHSVFARLLRTEATHLGYPTNFTIYDTEDSKSLLASIIKEQNLSSDTYKTNVVYNRISQAKNNLLTPAAYLKIPEIVQNDAAAGLPKIGELYKLYANRCAQAGAMDFDDLLVKTYALLVSKPEVLEKYQKRFTYVMIDEFQDTNPAQYAIVKLLSQKHRNICVVGDDAQSIYAFRGATIRNILNYETDYPELKTYKLEQNYRSTQRIVAIANEVIAANSNQINKKIWTDNAEGTMPKLFVTASDIEEAKLVADSIFEERLRNHFKNDEFAIMYRTNSQSRLFEEALRRRNIPYKVYGGTSFYQRKEVKDVMAYLRLVVNPNDEEALRRVINYPTRGIGKTTIDKITALARHNNVGIWQMVATIKQTTLPNNAKEAIHGFYKMMQLFTDYARQTDAYETAKYIARQANLLQELHNDKSVEGLSRYENVMELFNSIKDFVDNKREVYSADMDNSLGAYLQEVSLLTDLDKDDDEVPRVRLTTIHNAKGLEFACVYVVGLEEKLFPSEMASRTTAEIEEERRLFYVAVTRAEKKLHLSYAASRQRFGTVIACEPSRFLSEINPYNLEIRGGKASMTTMPSYKSNNNSNTNNENHDPSNAIRANIKSAQQLNQNKNAQQNIVTTNIPFKPSDNNQLLEGMTVMHRRFGKGKITQLDGRGDGRMAIIVFEVMGEKRIMLKFAELMIVE